MLKEVFKAEVQLASLDLSVEENQKAISALFLGIKGFFKQHPQGKNAKNLKYFFQVTTEYEQDDA